jgi:hypothetical protein
MVLIVGWEQALASEHLWLKCRPLCLPIVTDEP